MARREKGTDKWRADIMVNGKRKQKICATEDEANKLEAEYAHQLIDGKPLNKVRGISQITLREAGNNALNNPQVGFSKALKDFSIRLPLINGGYRHTPRNVATRFNVNSIMPISEANSFFDFYRAFRSKPFPVTVLTDMPSAQAEAQEYSLFCYMIDAPEMESVNTIGDYVNVNFIICEVI